MLLHDGVCVRAWASVCVRAWVSVCVRAWVSVCVCACVAIDSRLRAHACERVLRVHARGCARAPAPGFSALHISR
jgi:hypothetical protein